MQVTKLKRFRAANAKTRVHLYKQLVLPIMEYPPVPTHALSKSKLATLQIDANKRRTSLLPHVKKKTRSTTSKILGPLKITGTPSNLLQEEK